MKLSQEQIAKRTDIVIGMLKADPKVPDVAISKELKKKTGTGSTGRFLTMVREKFEQSQKKFSGPGTKPLKNGVAKNGVHAHAFQAPAPHVVREEPAAVAEREEPVQEDLTLDAAKKDAKEPLRALRDILLACPDLKAIGLVKKGEKVVPFVDEQVTKRSTLEL